jgi:hypothetical protein
MHLKDNIKTHGANLVHRRLPNAATSHNTAAEPITRSLRPAAQLSKRATKTSRYGAPLLTQSGPSLYRRPNVAIATALIVSKYSLRLSHQRGEEGPQKGGAHD